MTREQSQAARDWQKQLLVRCETCGRSYAPDSKCYCKMPNHVVVTLPNGDTISTRINGTRDEVVEYYRHGVRATSILFQDTEELVKL